MATRPSSAAGFAGKDNYVSPEQVGLYGGEVTAKSDIYSLGLLLFYALTGQKLDMGGSQFQLVEKRRRVPDLGGVDMRIRPLLEQMLQPDPANRPATMADIANWRIASSSSPRSFDPLARVETSAFRPEPYVMPRPRRRSLWLIFAAIILAALAGEGVYAFYTLVWSVPGTVKPPPLPEFGQKSAPVVAGAESIVTGSRAATGNTAAVDRRCRSPYRSHSSICRAI